MLVYKRRGAHHQKKMMQNRIDPSGMTSSSLIAKAKSSEKYDRSMEELKMVDLYDFRSIKFVKKNSQVEKDKSVPERMKRMEANYQQHGMKRTVEAAIAVNIHGHPHIMLLRIGNNQKGFYKLPGGRCRRGETEEECLKRKLTKRLAPEDPNEPMPEWIVHGVISVWYRPNFETLLVCTQSCIKLTKTLKFTNDNSIHIAQLTSQNQKKES